MAPVDTLPAFPSDRSRWSGMSEWEGDCPQRLRDAFGRFDPAFNLSLALVAGPSAITCVVIRRILERSALRTWTETPAQAPARLLEQRPCIVVADQGSHTDDCRDIIAAVAGMRRAAGTGLPLLVLLTPTTLGLSAADPGGTADAVVAKPITPEALQPIVENLLEPFRR